MLQDQKKTTYEALRPSRFSSNPRNAAGSSVISQNRGCLFKCSRCQDVTSSVSTGDRLRHSTDSTIGLPLSHERTSMIRSQSPEY
ncbi:hypothetical protein UPYG_G00320600 [Umbra pygmaea]|uniref:Uncharacterized protein n=1 Tax=Umbra pygmaea TaxID=75934 RepID=A0ABD0WFH9_UMBPY